MFLFFNLRKVREKPFEKPKGFYGYACPVFPKQGLLPALIAAILLQL
jgi:hypothetical protein